MDEAYGLWQEGLSASEIGRKLGVPQRTVAHWVKAWCGHPRARGLRIEQPPPWPPDLRSYAYLLGLYLGDGHIAAVRGSTYVLRLALDAAYPRIAAEALAAIHRLLPTRNPRVGRARDVKMFRVECNSRWWPDLLPQHGPGRKHERPIILEPWQRLITETHPHELLRGLIHSDGCRYVANQRDGARTYRYVRYMFSNRSEDILQIFCDHADLLGVRWTRPNFKEVQMARRDSVAVLERFIGPKR
ncbi:MAG TPA: helix-turn-helix domain-containing protein [Thermoleophilaceae bacterium]|jgi:hypothetical protein|nr:helix-turn-helix domain-containing protein [Thermoleophilaceae bacterium]